MSSLPPAPPRAEGAGRPREDLDVDSRVGGRVELRDDLLVGEVVDLDPDARLLAGVGGSGAAADVLDQAGPHREGRDQQLPERLRPPEAGQVVEQVGEVGGDLLVRGEEAEVLVQRGP